MLITRFSGLAPWEAQYGYSRVVVAGDWAITAGTTATGLEGVLHPGDPYRQTLAAFKIALDALLAAVRHRSRSSARGCTSPTSPRKPRSDAPTRKSLARFGRWRPWSRWRGLPIQPIWSRSRSRRTSEPEHPDPHNGRLTAVIERRRV